MASEADLELIVEALGIKEFIAETRALNKAMLELIQQSNKAAGGIDGVGESSKKAAKETKFLGFSMTQIKQAAGALGVAFGLDTFKNLIVGAAQSAMAYETLGIQFEVFLGSAEKATAVLAELNTFSAVTPFTPDEVNASGRALLALGIAQEKLIPSLTLVGDLAAGVGTNFEELAVIYGKAMSQGIVQQEDLNMFQDKGINIMGELAKMFDTNIVGVKKLASTSKITSEMFGQALGQMNAEGALFNGMMDKMSQSTEGLLSTIEGKIQDELRAIGQAMLPTIRIIAEGFEPAWKLLKDAIIELYTPLASMFASLGDIAKILGITTGEGNAFVSVIKVVTSVFKVLTFPARMIYETIDLLAKAFLWAVEGISSFVNSSPRLLAVIESLSGPLSIVTDQFRALGELFGLIDKPASDASQAYDGVVKSLANVAKGMGATGEQTKAFAKGFDMATIAGMTNVDAMAEVKRQFAAYLLTTNEATTSTDDFAKAIGGVTAKALPAAGSIDALNAQMKLLQDQFNATSSEFERSELAKKLEELGIIMQRMKGGTDLTILPPQAVGQVSDFAAAAEHAQRSMSDLDNMGAGVKSFEDQMSKRGAAIVALREKMVELGETLKTQLTGAFVQFGASAADAIGQAIGAGTSLKDAFRDALVDMLVNVPKLVGMAMLNAAAAGPPSPASLALAIGGLALLGLSGVISGANQKAKAAKEANLNGVGNVGANNGNRQEGGGAQGLASAAQNLGQMQFTMELDGNAVAYGMWGYNVKEGKRRGVVK